jgi:hypothetical protein
MAFVQDHHADPRLPQAQERVAGRRVEGGEGVACLSQRRPRLAVIDSEALLVVGRVVGREVADPHLRFFG